MGSPFDRMKRLTFDGVAKAMGDDALWYPGGDLNAVPVPAKVLFNEANTAEQVGTKRDDVPRPTVEFKNTDWPGLRESVNSKAKEVIEVDGTLYNVLKIVGKKSAARDGDVFVANLTPKS